jgi:predicted amidohydrolase
MKIALASPPFPKSINDGLSWVEKLAKEAAAQQAEIVCFPESYIPGYPVMEEYKVEAATAAQLEAALDKVCHIAAEYSIAIIIPMDWYADGSFFNVAQVISAKGEKLGYQTKNQLDPSEDNQWSPGTKRHIFEVNDVKFGIAVCHEGFRYPETTRWAARNGAKIVFHPHFAGSDTTGTLPTEWGSMSNPYYEKAMMMRSIESTVYFASVNYATKFPESATSLIAPDGKLIAHEAYGKVGVLVADIDPELATGYLASRLKPETYV